MRSVRQPSTPIRRKPRPMKTLTLAAALTLFLSSWAHAQCKSGGHVTRPVPRPHHGGGHIRWQPGPPTPWRGGATECPVSSVSASSAGIAKSQPTTVKVSVGQQITIDGRFFGSQPGSVLLQIGATALPAEIVHWSSTRTVVVLPSVPLQGPVRATIVVKTAFGRVADQSQVQLQPALSVPPMPAENPAPTRPAVSAGQTVTLDGRAFGPTPGRVQVVIGALTLHANVLQWGETSVQATLPSLAFTNAVPATVQIMTATGQLADQVDITLQPASAIEAPAAPADPAFAQR